MFNRSRSGETIVSIVLETHKRKDNEIPHHFINEIKTQCYHVIDVNVFPLKLRFLPKKVNSVLTIPPNQKISHLQQKNTTNKLEKELI